MKPLSLNWNLDTIFPGGADSPAFAEFLIALGHDITAFDDLLQSGDLELPALVEAWQALLLRVREAGGFVTCLQAQDAADREAVALAARVRELQSALEAAGGRFDQRLLALDDERWGALLRTPELRAVVAALNERRARAAEKLAPDREALIGALALDGYHGWSAHYRTLAARVRVPFEGELLSVAQAENRLSRLNPTELAALFENYEDAWADCAEPCADALNSLAGFRLSVYRQRGWQNVTKEALDANRIGEATLDAMWRAVREGSAVLVRFLERKARLLGVEKLGWADVDVPVSAGARDLSYQAASEQIVASFARFDPSMAALATRALAEGWVEAEVRAGKRNGGFSKTLPLSRQSRVFLSFGGGLAHAFTLAHELGHAYHQELMIDLPALAQRYPMTVAESASTFAERLFADFAREDTRDEREKLAILEASAGRAATYLMNIRARFEFEIAFYAERAGGRVSAARLSELCVAAQRAAFGDALATYHPHGWASRRHFFFTDQPFYNFPYTCGFLLSAQLDARRRANAGEFGAHYADFLRASGALNLEELGREFFAADLSQPDFWCEAVENALRDVRLFLEATENA